MNRILVDSNILLDLFLQDSKWGNWSENQLAHYGISHTLYINPIIYSEVSIGFHKIEDLEQALIQGGIVFRTLPKEALFLAGKVFLKYRKRKGVKSSPLPDFFIGAHACVEGMPLLTRDNKRYPYYFPMIQLITPQ